MTVMQICKLNVLIDKHITLVLLVRICLMEFYSHATQLGNVVTFRIFVCFCCAVSIIDNNEKSV